MRRSGSTFAISVLAAVLCAGAPVQAQENAAPALGANLERFAYPWPVREFPVTVGITPAHMAYMDVAPERSNGRTIVLLHGKNFCGATWEDTGRALLAAGYRVLIPDQIGFCKSSKPREAQYTFAMLAHSTRELMKARGVEDAIVIGHSTGGMLAMHFALMYPEAVDHLVLVNPLGLTDRTAEGVPYLPLDELVTQEREKDFASIKAYQRNVYYHGEWQPRYDRWVTMLAGQYASENGEDVAFAQAKTSEMILTQPVSHHLERLTMRVTLMIGMLDTTTFGKGQAPPEVAERLRPIPKLAPAAAQRIPDARLVTFADLGHSPQVEAPDRFGAQLLAALDNSPASAREQE
ncbi:alpha/beta fold hydrolase [Altericroceibacterium xinjiangense]|uniref:alpha/beta fold hydrolase n=1 Tax=Altericroceibacterium xinjiangense TaxID=762261 RepID=UPI000F7EFDB2|nr:alpha/beta hydrolase [Altericroceibacterium xinjiangense]